MSKLCAETFTGFATAQVKKAQGLNKKINTPVEQQRKTPRDFCYIAEGYSAVPLSAWLAGKGWNEAQCGLASVPNMRDLFALFYDASGTLGFSGIMQKETANEVALSNIPRGLVPAAIMSFNKDAYSMHCRQYLEYQTWLTQRNEARYQSTLAHGKNYDAKNLMHTIRLLNMATEIIENGLIQVRRPDREFLLSIRNGSYEYDALMEMAAEKIARIKAAVPASPLPDNPDRSKIESLLISCRKAFYG